MHAFLLLENKSRDKMRLRFKTLQMLKKVISLFFFFFYAHRTLKKQRSSTGSFQKASDTREKNPLFQHQSTGNHCSLGKSRSGDVFIIRENTVAPMFRDPVGLECQELDSHKPTIMDSTLLFFHKWRFTDKNREVSTGTVD